LLERGDIRDRSHDRLKITLSEGFVKGKAINRDCALAFYVWEGQVTVRRDHRDLVATVRKSASERLHGSFYSSAVWWIKLGPKGDLHRFIS
jgi:hypothetical protein